MNSFQRIETPAQMALLRQLDEAGVVLETWLLQASAPSGSALDDGRQALLASMGWHSLPQTGRENWVEAPCLGADGSPIQPRGEEIDWARFCGAWPEPYRIPGSGPGRRWSLQLPPGSAEAAQAFFYALFMPPYPISLPGDGAAIRQQLQDWRDRYFGELLHIHNPADVQALCIIRWHTDWSTYFDAGHEWWGAFCWTLHDRRNGQITLIKAASTD